MDPQDSPTSPFKPLHASDLQSWFASPQPEHQVPHEMSRNSSPHLLSNTFQIVPRQTLPAGGLKRSTFIGDQLRVAAGSLGEDGATVHVGMVVPSLVVAHNLEGLAVLHNLRGQASQAHYPGEEERRAGEEKAPSPWSATTPKQQVNSEKDNSLPQQTSETDGLQQARQEITRSLQICWTISISSESPCQG